MKGEKQLMVWFTEEEAFELLMRCLSHEAEDNETFRSAVEKLASSIRSDSGSLAA